MVGVQAPQRRALLHAGQLALDVGDEGSERPGVAARTSACSPEAASFSTANSRTVSSIPKRPSARVSEAVVGERGDAVERRGAAGRLRRATG